MFPSHKRLVIRVILWLCFQPITASMLHFNAMSGGAATTAVPARSLVLGNRAWRIWLNLVGTGSGITINILVFVSGSLFK